MTGGSNMTPTEIMRSQQREITQLCAEIERLRAENHLLKGALLRIRSECLYDADREDLIKWIADCVAATMTELRGEGEK